MQLGVSLPAQELGSDLRALARYATLTEQLGFSHLRVGDQLVRPDAGPSHEPLTLLAFLAGATQRIELVTTVLVVPSRSTLLVAKQAAQVDCLSGGRLRLGVGIGRYAPVYGANGKSFTNRGVRIEEQINLLRSLWTQDRVDFEGRWEQVSGLALNPLPVQRPIPIWYGANRYPKAQVLDRIARLADGWFAICPLERFEKLRQALLLRVAAAGRAPHAVGIEAQMDFPASAPDAWLSELDGWRRLGVERIAVRAPALGAGESAHVDALHALQALANQAK